MRNLNCPEQGKLWIRCGTSLSYEVADDIRVSGIVNNVLNKIPLYCETYSDYQDYSFANDNVFGRYYAIEIDWHFGQNGK